MSRPRPVADQIGLVDHVDAWQPEPLDDLSDVVMFDQFDPFWRDRVDGRDIDVARTAELAVWDHRVRCSGPRDSGRTRSGTPWHRLTGDERVERVHLAHRQGTWSNPFPTERVPLPQWVRSYGDPRPGGWGDFQTFLVDPGVELIELSSFAPSGIHIPGVAHVPFPPNVRWRCDNLQRWDLTKDWREHKGSIVAGGFPMLPMIPRVDELDRGPGGLAKVLHMSLPFYNGTRLAGHARKTDGLVPNFPLYAGDQLVLARNAAQWLRDHIDLTIRDLALLWSLERYGVVIDDRSTGLRGVQTPEAFTAAAGPNIRMPQETDLGITIDRLLRLSDFRVVRATFNN